MVIAVCTGGENPPSSLSLAWLNASQRIVAADGGLAFLKHLKQKADVWIGDGDSLGGELVEWKPWFVEARTLDRAKDETDTEAAVRVAIDEGAHEIWLLGGSGGRMDHWLANLRLMASRPMLTRWLTRYEQIQAFGPGETLVLSPGTVSIFPLGDGPWEIGSQGLRWPLEHVDFHRWYSLSNEVPSTGAFLTAEAGRFLLLRPLLQGETG